MLVFAQWLWKKCPGPLWTSGAVTTIQKEEIHNDNERPVRFFVGRNCDTGISRAAELWLSEAHLTRDVHFSIFSVQGRIGKSLPKVVRR